MNTVGYSVMTFIDRILKRNTKRCRYCGRRLSETEIKYYDNTCNKCEGKITMQLWKE